MRTIRNIIISGVLLCDIGSVDSTAAPNSRVQSNNDTVTGQPEERSTSSPQSADTQFVTPKSADSNGSPRTAPKATVTEKMKEAVVSVTDAAVNNAADLIGAVKGGVTGAVKGAAVHVVKKGIQHMEKEKGPCPGPFRVTCTRESSETMDWNCEITTQNWGQKDGAPRNCQTFGKAEHGTKQELQEKFLKCGGIWTHKPQGTTTTKYYTGIDAEKGVLGYGNPNKIEIARGPLCKAKIH